MIGSYWKLAFRHLKSIYSLINLTGLSVAVAVFLLVLTWVEQEWSYDTFHSGHERTFRVLMQEPDNTNAVKSYALTPPRLLDYLRANESSWLENSSRFVQVDFLLRHEENAFYKKGLAADPEFFKVFTFPLTEGDLSQFEGEDKMVLSQSVARAFFGDAPAVGKTIRISTRDFAVVAVAKDPPPNSTLQFGYVITLATIKAVGLIDMETWDVESVHTYVKLTSATESTKFASAIEPILRSNRKESKASLQLQSLKDVRLYSEQVNNDIPGWHGDIQYVYIFSSVAIFVLIIACINYTNLALARSHKRSKETGVRKAAGAARNQLVFQFFSESLVYALLAGALAIGLAWLSWPSFESVMGKSFDFFYGNFILRLSILIAAVVICGLLAGSYPALFLSSLKPTVAFHGILREGRKAASFRRMLLTIQLTLSLGFVVSTLIIQHQLGYLQHRDLGYDRNDIAIFHLTRRQRAQYVDFKNALLQQPSIENVTLSSANISFTDAFTTRVSWEGLTATNTIPFHVLSVDHDFAKAYRLKLVAGRDFAIDHPSDSSAVLLNEEAVRQMDIKDPVGKTFTRNGKAYQILGVVHDFNFKSAHQKIEPMVLYIDETAAEVSVRFKAGHHMEGVEALRKKWKEFSPDRPLEYTFVQDDVEKLYENDYRTSKLFGYFSVLSIFVSCLGLIGIVMFAMDQRAKEIAVRKVMGASVGDLLLGLSREYLTLVVIANLVGLPFSYYFIRGWLDKFAYAADVPVNAFIVTGVLSLILVGLTIAYFTLRAALSSPVRSLRSE